MLTSIIKIRSLLLLLLLTARAFAQSDTGYLSLLNQQIRAIQPGGIIYYADKPAGAAIHAYFSPTNDAFDLVQKHGLTFTAAEKKYIIRQLKKFRTLSWPDSLFDLSKRIGADTIVRFVQLKGRLIADSLPPAANYSEASAVRPWAFFFSQPIYLRNNTLLLCYFMYFHLNAGEHGVRIFKKEKDQWSSRGAFGGGVF